MNRLDKVIELKDFYDTDLKSIFENDDSVLITENNIPVYEIKKVNSDKKIQFASKEEVKEAFDYTLKKYRKTFEELAK